MIRKEPRKLVNKTYKAVVFQPAIDFLQQLSVSAFIRLSVCNSDRLGVTMHPAQPDWTFDEIVKV